MKYLLSVVLVLSLYCSPLPVMADWTLHSGATWKSLANNTMNDGAENWTVTKPATNQARIRVRSVLDSAAVDISDAFFIQ